MPPFWLSIALLSLLQGAVVAIPRPASGLKLRLRGRRFAAIPAVSVIAFVLIAGAAERASAQGLTYLALCAVPALAALALAWPSRERSQSGLRPARELVGVPLIGVASVD